jgi:hypothetical protein
MGLGCLEYQSDRLHGPMSVFSKDRNSHTWLTCLRQLGILTWERRGLLGVDNDASRYAFPGHIKLALVSARLPFIISIVRLNFSKGQTRRFMSVLLRDSKLQKLSDHGLGLWWPKTNTVDVMLLVIGSQEI